LCAKIQSSRRSFPQTPPIQVKIVFWGSAYSGKTTTLRCIASSLKPHLANKPLSVETTDKHTLYLDYVPILIPLESGQLGRNCLIHLVTTTGQKRFLCTRERAAKGADAVIFVADSCAHKIDDNIRSFDELMAFKSNGEIPIIVQANKQDLEDALGVDEIRSYMNLPQEIKVLPTVATTGKGLDKLFFAALKQALRGMFGIEKPN
jgi:small GTP-binding protein